MSRFKGFASKFRSGYRNAALMLLNTLAVLALLNAALAAAFMLKDRLKPNPVSEKYGEVAVYSAYPGMSEKEVDTLLEETWTRPYLYESFTEFKERAYKGRYVNVDEHGFRVSKGQGAWPLEKGKLNVFLFGGSTTFGYGVPDGETIASHFQTAMAERLGRDARVYNFGRGFYYSTQERILFEELLASGVVPDMAIFIDGLNDFYFHSGETLFSPELRELVDNENANSCRSAPATAIGRAAEAIRKRLGRSRAAEAPQADSGHKDYDDPQVIDPVIERYLANKKMIEGTAEAFGVKAVFVWQPVPTHEYDLKLHKYGDLEEHMHSRRGYERMEEIVKRAPQGDSFLWSADLQRDAAVPLYIDKVHYSPAFSKRLAESIAEKIVKRKLAP